MEYDFIRHPPPALAQLSPLGASFWTAPGASFWTAPGAHPTTAPISTCSHLGGTALKGQG